jgi:hypothetical protein
VEYPDPLDQVVTAAFCSAAAAYQGVGRTVVGQPGFLGDPSLHQEQWRGGVPSIVKTGLADAGDPQDAVPLIRVAVPLIRVSLLPDRAPVLPGKHQPVVLPAAPSS